MELLIAHWGCRKATQHLLVCCTSDMKNYGSALSNLLLGSISTRGKWSGLEAGKGWRGKNTPEPTENHVALCF